MMEEPQTIAEIPQDPTGSLGRVLASDIHTVARQEKQKAPELALAIDRQGVNIYNVRQSRLITSYAVSPQAIFTCAPCSLRFRSTAHSPAHRLTFCSLRSPNLRLLCFSETLNPDLAEGSPITTSTFDLENSGSPVVHLEAFIAGDNYKAHNSNVHLLAIKQNGEVVCYTKSLKEEVWSFRACSANEEQVLHVKVANIVQLKTGLLQRRDDILASLGAAEDETQHKVLILISRVGSTKHEGKSTTLALRIFKINVVDTDLDRSMGKFQSKPREVFSIDIPEAIHLQEQESTFTLHVTSGTLYQQTPSLITIYDLADLLPKIIHEVALEKADIISFLRLSPFTLAVSMPSAFSLIGLPYCSIQGGSSPAFLHATGHDPLRLLSHSPSLGVMVAIKGRRLMTIRIPYFSSKSMASRKRKREGTLIGSIGRGSHSAAHVKSDGELSRSMKSVGTSLTTSEELGWESEKIKLDAIFSTAGAEAFSNAIAPYLEVQNPDGTPRVDQPKVSYLLIKLFDVKRNDLATRNKLELKANYFDYDDIFRWLLRKNLLTIDRIEIALKRSGSLHVTERLEPSAVIDTLTEVDPSLRLLTSLVGRQSPLSPQEIATALGAVIQKWDGAETSETPKLVADADPQTKQMQTNGNNDQSNNPKKPSSTVTASVASTPQLLHLILHRLFTLPQSTVTSALRAQLTKPHLIHLVDILRIEIAHSGWLSPYDDKLSPLSTAFSSPNNKLTQITHLLNSTIDAIGAGGWIIGTTGSSNDSSSVINTAIDDNMNTIPYMKAEISAALEGIEEAVYLQSMLAEVLLCGKDTLTQSQSQSKKKIIKNKTKPAPVVATQDDDAAERTRATAALPLGLKLESTKKYVSSTKVGAGGELIRRSKRDILRLKSRMVGKYSFERISV